MDKSSTRALHNIGFEFLFQHNLSQNRQNKAKPISAELFELNFIVQLYNPVFQRIPKIFKKYSKIIAELCQKYPKSNPTVSHNHLQLSQKYPKSILKVS